MLLTRKGTKYTKEIGKKSLRGLVLFVSVVVNKLSAETVKPENYHEIAIAKNRRLP
jgi:hypothetical protein